LSSYEKITIPFSDIFSWANDIFLAVGMDEDDAKICTDNLVTADLRGV